MLDGPTLANIFLGKVTKWNDPAIATLNPGVTLPAKDIVVVHRSDGSGTTYIFTDYLSRSAPSGRRPVGNATSVKWPVGLGGKGNEGVSGTLTQTDGRSATSSLPMQRRTSCRSRASSTPRASQSSPPWTRSRPR